MTPEGWKLREISQLVDFKSGGTPSKSRKELWDGPYPWVSAKDMKFTKLSQSILTLSEDGFLHAKKAAPGDILILVRGMTLFKDVPVGMAVKPLAFNQDIKALTPRNIDGQFLLASLQGRKRNLMRLVDQANHGTGRLSTDLLSSFSLLIPPLPEQKKIAKILSTWDRAIETTEKLVENAEVQKNGLAKQLLSGTRRLEKFGIAPWRDARMVELFTERAERGNSHLPLLAITGNRGVIPQSETDRRDTSNEDKSSYKQIHPGDIGYNSMRMWQGVSARSSLLGLVSPAYTVLKPTLSIDARFAAHLFKLPKQVHLFRRYSQGLTSDTWNLKFKQFSDVPTSIPPVAEQLKIADVLDAADMEIAVLCTQLKNLESEKKALMQQLLTGKHRVKVDGGA